MVLDSPAEDFPALGGPEGAGMTTRMTLRRRDGRPYLRRRGFECRWFGAYLHRIDAPDPDTVPHDHPWWFASLVLRGGYTEVRRDTRTSREWVVERGRWSVRSMRLDEAHHIVDTEPGTVTLVIRGPKVRRWGFWPGASWVDWEQLPREQRDLSYEDAS